MVNQATRELLLRLADRYETASFIEGDPSWWMHQVDGEANREATAFVAQALSYGSRSQFMPKIGHLLALANGDMHRWIASGAYSANFSPDDRSSYYRLYSHAAMRRFFDAYRALLDEYGTLGGFITENGRKYSAKGTKGTDNNAAQPTAIEAVEAICHWFASHQASDTIPKDTTSACKRICMFLRWMVRSGSPVDLGLWADRIDRRTLIMPLDTHVVSEAMKLDLLSSRCASMSAARRLTAAMAEIFPDDPLRGDFALFGYGVNQQI